MTVEDITDDDLKNFENKTQKEKADTLETLYRKARENAGGVIQEVDFDGQMTVKVFDEDGEEKQTQKVDI
jgi:hypothetical protein